MPILEEHAIYRVGRSSLVVTLPRNWLNFHGLMTGDKVEIVGNGELTIRPLKRKGSRSDQKRRKECSQSKD